MKSLLSALICSLSIVAVARAEPALRSVNEAMVCESDEVSDEVIDPACEDGLCPKKSQTFEVDFDGSLPFSECHTGSAKGNTWAAKQKAIEEMLNDAKDEGDTSVDIDALCEGTCAGSTKCTITGIILTGTGSTGTPSYNTGGGKTKVSICSHSGGERSYYVTCGCVDPEGPATFPACSMGISLNMLD